MRGSQGPWLVVLAAVSALTACSGSDDINTSEVIAISPTWDEVTASTRTDDPRVVVANTVAVLRGEWGPLVGATTDSPLVRGGILGVDEAEKRSATASCGDRSVDPAQLSSNALYCAEDDSLLFDVNTLGRTILGRHGVMGMALVTAHEVAHSVQARSGSALDPLVAELQADCLAGELAAAVVGGEVDGWSFTRRQLALPVRALLDLRDAPGTTPDHEGAHGTGFDRISAFLDGFFRRSARCLDYADNPPVVTGQPFEDAEQQITRGERPLTDLVLLAHRDLDAHHERLADTIGLTWTPITRVDLLDGVGCQGQPASRVVQFCADGTVVAQKHALETIASTGDAAVLLTFARAWSLEGAMERWGNVFGGVENSDDCLVGFWLGSHHPAAPSAESFEYVLPPGALDEVADALLKQPGTDPLARLRALLDGFHRGRKACESAPDTTTTSGSP